MKFSAQHSLSLLNSMLHIEDKCILVLSLHPKCKGMLPATEAQKAECYRSCRAPLPKLGTTTTPDTENEPPRKEKKILEQLMDHKIIKTKTTTITTATKDELDIQFEVDKGKDYTSPLIFWKECESVFPNLSKLAHRIYSILCTLAAVKRIGQIINQRRTKYSNC